MDNEKKPYIKINSCAKQPVTVRHVTLREHGHTFGEELSDFGLQYIAEGRCYYEDDGEEKYIDKGFALLQFPGVRQHYYFKGDRSLLLWCHFCGELCEEKLGPFNNGGTVAVDLRKAKNFESCFYRMISAHNIKAPYYEMETTGYLSVLLGAVAESLAHRSEMPPRDAYAHMEQVIDYMHLHFDEPIDLEKCAEMCCLSQSRFAHVFKQHTGVSPYHYQLSVRIERAIDILSTEEISVKDCAEAVGFADSSYFCRVFKKFTGKSPAEYK